MKIDVVTHVHSNVDTNGTCRGEGSMWDMANCARARGYLGIVFTEHSSDPHSEQRPLSLGDLELIFRQRAENIARASYSDFRVWDGVEANLTPFGEIDFPRSLKRWISYLVASQHGGLGFTLRDPDGIAKRFAFAAANPIIDALAHPTRNIEDVEGIDWEKVLTLVRAENTMVEINSNHFWKNRDLPSQSHWVKFFRALANSGSICVWANDVHNEHMFPTAGTLAEQWHTPSSSEDQLLEIALAAGICREQIVNLDYSTWNRWITTPKKERGSLISW